jgi:CheY-like chemotaxis protein
VLGGLEATRQIRRDELERSRPRTPVVAFTSSHLGRDPSTLHAFGIDAVLHKPCSEQALDACLRRWCTTAPGASA